MDKIYQIIHPVAERPEEAIHGLCFTHKDLAEEMLRRRGFERYVLDDSWRTYTDVAWIKERTLYAHIIDLPWQGRVQLR